MGTVFYCGRPSCTAPGPRDAVTTWLGDSEDRDRAHRRKGGTPRSHFENTRASAIRYAAAPLRRRTPRIDDAVYPPASSHSVPLSRKHLELADPALVILDCVSLDVLATGGHAWSTTLTPGREAAIATGERDEYSRRLESDGANLLSSWAEGRAEGRSSVSLARPTLDIQELRIRRDKDTVEVVAGLTPRPLAYTRGRPPPEMTRLPTMSLDPGRAALRAVQSLSPKGVRQAKVQAAYEFVMGTPEPSDGCSADGLQKTLEALGTETVIARSWGECEMHCRAEGRALLIVEDGNPSTYVLVRKGEHVRDPEGDTGIGRRWLQGERGLFLRHALVVLDRKGQRELLAVTGRLTRSLRPGWFRQSAYGLWNRPIPGMTVGLMAGGCERSSARRTRC